MKRCGITRGVQPTKQQQPPAPSATGSPLTSRQIQSPTQILVGALADTDENGKPSPTTIALIVVVAVPGVGYIALAIGYVMRRNSEKKARTRGMQYFDSGREFSPQTAMFANEKGLSESRSTPYDPPSGGL